MPLGVARAHGFLRSRAAAGGGGATALDVDAGDIHGTFKQVVAGSFDSDPSTLNIVSQPSNGQVSVNGLLMVYDPSGGTAAVAGNTYTWDYDGDGGTAGTVTIRYRTTHKVKDTSTDPDEQLVSPGGAGDEDLETSGS